MDIAIVGMACLFPGAQDIKRYWQNIINKVDAIGDPPEDWGGEFYFDPNSADNDRIYCKRGGYLGDISRFDPLDYGIIPMAVDGAEPEHFLALRVAHEALKDAGFPDIPINRDRTEVILGRGTFINRGYTTLHQHGLFIDQFLCLLKELHPGYTQEDLKLLKQRLKAKLPPFNSQTAPGLVSSIMSGRIANRLDLKGTNYTVDAACASSLIAVELAVNDLLVKKCDAVIAGGVQLAAHHLMLMVFCQLGALSRSSQIRPFDKDADGTLLGEGVGMVVLKRLEDAERDGSRIYAVIKGIGSASDGKAKSVIAPRLEGEQLAIKRAYEKAGISPATIGLIEAHGTSMPMGDITEFQALSSIFGTRNGRSAKCAIGSVKSMIAHLIPASGMAGLIKTAFALYHKVLPPTLHCDVPNPQLEIEKSPFYINTETRPWIHGYTESPRRAGVNAFGFGGINAHAIIEEYTGSDESKVESYQCTWDTELCIFSGESRHDLIERCKRIQNFLSSVSDIELKDFAYTVNSTIEGKSSRLAIVGSSLDEIARKLAHALNKLQDPVCKRIKDKSGIYYFQEPLVQQGTLAFLFPGEGSQYINMLSDLCIHFPEVRHCFDILDRAFADHPRNYLPSNVVFPPPSGKKEERIAQKERIWQMEGAVDAVITADRALFRLFNLLGIQPHAVLGHSSGEFMSLEAAGSLEYCGEEELIQYIRSGNNAIERLSTADEIHSSVLIAVGAVDRSELLRIIQENHGRLFVAMDNCPNQAIICGDKEITTKVLEQLQAIGAVCQALPFARPYHTPMFESASGVMREFFSNLKIVSPKIKIYSCMTARPMPSDTDEIRKLVVGQWAHQVRFRETIESMYHDGVRIFLEVGPNSNLTGFVNDILKGSPCLAVASNVHHRSGISQLNHALGILAAHGVPMHLSYLYKRRLPRRLEIETVGMNALEQKDKKFAPRLPLALPTLGIGPKMAEDIIKNSRDRHVPSQHNTTILKDSLTDNETSFSSTSNEYLAKENVYRNLVSGASQRDVLASDSLRSKGKVMKEYIQTMEQFLESQQSVMQEYLRRKMPEKPTVNRCESKTTTQMPSAEHKEVNKMPFITKITSYTAGEELTAFREFDLAEDLFLMDHTLGREISVIDSRLTGLPIMPLTVSLEILAEAASKLLPDKVLIGMKEVRAYKWIAFEGKRLILKINAKCQSAEEVNVQICESHDSSVLGASIGMRLVEGVMIFGGKYPEPPAISEFSLKGKMPSRWTPERLYTEGMLHGPCFHGVVSVDGWGTDGAEATLRVPPVNGFFRSQSAPYFVTDHVLLDAVGQIVAYWNAQKQENDLNTFPFRIESLYIYGSILQPMEQVKCRVQIKPQAENQLRANMDVIGQNGLLHMRIVGWDDRVFDLPVAFHRARFRAREVFLSTSWPEPISKIPESEALECCRMQDYPDELLHAHGMVWLRVLAYLVLNRQEREVWWKLQGSKNRRIEWLLARVAAKDAIRLILKKRYGMELCPPDISIESDEYGRPVVRGSWTKDVKLVPSVSLAHKRGIGLAMAVEDGWGCGIDMEFLNQRIKEPSQITFNEDELDLMKSCMLSEDMEWIFRVWCAKEAIGKALGRGLYGSPQNLILRELYLEAGIVNLRVSGGLLREFPHLAGKTLTAYTVREGDLIIASAVYREEGQ